MNNPQPRRGAKPQGLVRLDTKITADQNSGLDELVTVTGVSKASLVRRAIADLLSGSALAPVAAEEISPTPIRGPGLASQRKDNE